MRFERVGNKAVWADYGLMAQHIIRAIAVVADSYKAGWTDADLRARFA